MRRIWPRRAGLAAAVVALLVAVGAAPSTAAAKSRPPLLVADLSKVSDDEQLLFAALQGLVNRSSARVYLIGFRNAQEWKIDPTAKTWLRDAVRRRTKRISPYGLLRRYRSQAKGLVIWDPALAVDTQNVATTMAGVKGLLPVSPALATRLRKRPYRLRVGFDLRRQHFETREEAYDWALEKFGPPSKFSLLAWLGGPRNRNLGQHGLRDLIVARRGFAFEAEPHRDWDFVIRLLDAFPRGTPVYGYPFHDDEFYYGSCDAGYCYATGEPFGVGEISRSGKYLIPSGSSTNLTVHSRFRPRAQHPRWDERPRKGDPGKTYVTFILSDGDSLGYNQHGLRTRHWDDRARGSIPMGISISPWLAVLEPRIYDYYVRTIKPSDVLIAGPSGAGYMYPQFHPDLGGFLAQSRRIMGLAGLRAIWILDNGYAASPSPAIVQQYVDALHPPVIFADYGGWVTPNPPAVSFTDGVPVVHALWGLDVSSTVQKVRLAAQSYPGRPAFVFVGAIAWTMGYSQAREVMRQLGPTYQVVRPDRFSGLLKGTYGE